MQNQIYKEELEDCLEYGIKRAVLSDTERIEDDNLILYRKYSRKDICKLLNWKSVWYCQEFSNYFYSRYESHLKYYKENQS